MNFVGFPSIESFHAVVKTAAFFGDPLLSYRGKVKLHGTNAAVRVCAGGREIAAQSRSQLITPQDDNAGFARWVAAQQDYFHSLPFEDATIFGEWCGPGIMKGTAINKISTKIFAVFALQLGQGEAAEVLVDPLNLDLQLLGSTTVVMPAGMFVLPWHGDAFPVDFRQPEQLRAVVQACNEQVAAVEKCDPWVNQQFNVQGVGEGLVYYPTAGASLSAKTLENFTFKAKGEEHKVVAAKQAVQIAPEVAASVDAFVALVVTPARLEQGLAAVGGSADPKVTGAFLKWMLMDTQKETQAELIASQLTWAQVQKGIQHAARVWFLTKSQEIS